MRQLVSKKDATLSVRAQCQMLEISRSGIYYKPVGISEENLEIMRLMDRHNTDHPDEGVLCMRNMLRGQDHTVNHKRIRRLMNLMDLQAIYPQRNLTKRAKGEYRYPYLLRGIAITHPNQVWLIDISYIAMKKWIHVSHCHYRHIQPIYCRVEWGWVIVWMPACRWRCLKLPLLGMNDQARLRLSEP